MKGSSATKNNIRRMEMANKPTDIWELHENEGLLKGFTEHPADQEVHTSYFSNPKRGGFKPRYVGVNRRGIGGQNTSMREYAKEHPYVKKYNNKKKKWYSKTIT